MNFEGGTTKVGWRTVCVHFPDEKRGGGWLPGGNKKKMVGVVEVKGEGGGRKTT